MIPIDLIETAVFYPPPGMEGWRYYRIEYGGHARECIMECEIWLPPAGDPEVVERMLAEMQGEV